MSHTDLTTTNGAIKPHSLPIIDISPYLSTKSTLANARAQTTTSLRAALLEHGFFYITNHSIPLSELELVLSHARTFFTTASATEKSILRRRDPGIGLGDGARGYQVMGENVTEGKRDWHEGVDWYREVRDGEGVEAGELEENGEGGVMLTAGSDGKDCSKIHTLQRNPPFDLLQGPNLWPSTPHTFRQIFTAHIARMRALGLAILRAMGQALDLADPEVFANAAKDSFWVMRAIGYPPLSAEAAAQGGVSCGEHSDYGCLTLLLADNTRGALQVRDRRGEWMGVEPIEGAFVVNVGDMVELWTAGLVRSTKHRVVHKGGGYRVSVPFFLEPGKDVIVEPLQECVSKMKELKRTPAVGQVRYWDHLVGKVGGNFYKGDG
jgi:isopenicillin N synthase-like dioxygenase